PADGGARAGPARPPPPHPPRQYQRRGFRADRSGAADERHAARHRQDPRLPAAQPARCALSRRADPRRDPRGPRRALVLPRGAPPVSVETVTAETVTDSLRVMP